MRPPFCSCVAGARGGGGGTLDVRQALSLRASRALKILTHGHIWAVYQCAEYNK